MTYKYVLAFDIPCQSQIINRKITHSDQIALLDTEHNAETQLGIQDATNTGNKCDMSFWAQIFIRGC